MRYDAVIVGGGHNGLVCAAYLARAGRRVLVLERRAELGGAAVSERPFAGHDPAIDETVRRIYTDLKSLLARDDLPPGLRANAVDALASVSQMMGDLALEYEMLYDLGV